MFRSRASLARVTVSTEIHWKEQNATPPCLSRSVNAEATKPVALARSRAIAGSGLCSIITGVPFARALQTSSRRTAAELNLYANGN